MTIKQASVNDIKDLLTMEVALWGSHSADELKNEAMQALFNDKECRFLAYEGKQVIGFAQGSLRNDYVEGAKTSPIGYIEGIFVDEKYRNRGVGKELIQAVEKWCGQKGCSEVASDSQLENETSRKFHEAIGFREANKIVCFIKKI